MESNSIDPLAVRHYHRRRTDVESHAHSQHDDEQRQHGNSDHDDQHSKKDSDTDKKEDSKDGKDDKQKKMSPKKKRMLIISAIVVAVVLIIGCVLYWLHARHYQTTDDAFVDGHVSQVSPQVGGRVLTLLIVDNQQVEAGQLLAEIDPRDYQIKLAQANAQKAQAVAQVALQKASIAQAEANVKVAEADAFQANNDLERFEKVNPEAITRQQKDNAIAAAKSANAKLDAARESVEASKAQESAAEASMQQADVEIDNAKLQLSYTKIIAPISGHITKRTVELGNVVSPGIPLLAVVSNELWVTANYKETQLTHMRIGQHVQIKIDAFPDAIFPGHVDSFQRGTGSVFSSLPAENATGNYVKVIQRIPVKIVFDDINQRDKYPMSPGMSVNPRVTVR